MLLCDDNTERRMANRYKPSIFNGELWNKPGLTFNCYSKYQPGET